MISRIRRHFEKILVAASVATLAASLFWLWRERPRVFAARRQVAEQPGPRHAAPKASSPGRLALAPWAAPRGAASAADPAFEVFTPPPLSYDAGEQRYVPRSLAPVRAPGAKHDTAIPVELLAVRREPFRVQLAGYFGAGGSYAGIFLDRDSHATSTVRAGGAIPNRRLTLRKLAVAKLAASKDGAGTSLEAVGVAIVADDDTGEEIRLENRGPHLTDIPVATVRLAPGGAFIDNVHAGDLLDSNGASYRVDRLQLDPPEASVSLVDRAGAQNRTQVLRPATSRNLLAEAAGGAEPGEDHPPATEAEDSDAAK